MYLTELMKENKISQYRLSKESGVAQATIADICSGKAQIEKCTAQTLYKIAKVLGVSIESLIEQEIEQRDKEKKRASFDVFKSNICHLVKDKGDINFIVEALASNEVRRLYNRGWYAEAFYILAMIDYLSKENHIPLCTNYNDIRAQKLKEMIYPTSAVLSDKAMGTDKHCKACLKTAIAEFLRFNIVESEIRNVC